MSSVLDKIRKLVALTQSPNENEARTAAHKACALILEHKVLLSLPHFPQQPARRDDLLEEIRRQKEATARCLVYGHFWDISRVQVEMTPEGTRVVTRCARCGATGVRKYERGAT